MALKQTIHEYLEKTPASTGPRLVQSGIMALIVLNVAAVVLETVAIEVDGRWIPLGQSRYSTFFERLEVFSVGVFTVEYLLRIFSITADPRYSRPLLGRLRFMATPLALVDLLSILPAFFRAPGFLAVRSLRLVRIFRVFKLGRYSSAIRSLNRAISARRAELLVTVFMAAIVLVLVSTVMYWAENEAQPDRFSSIPAAMWWGVVTLTTIGYGDISPITPLGKLLGGTVAMLGIGLIAVPTAIIGSAFIQELEANRKRPTCPHCGKELGPPGN